MSKYEYYKAMAQIEEDAKRPWDFQDKLVFWSAGACITAFIILMVTT